MRKIQNNWLSCLGVIGCLAVLFVSRSVAEDTGRENRVRRPNVLLILADDMGYSDIGCYGSEIKTPHLDRLAANGLRYTQFYNTARCWPTRAALMTGFYAQQVGRDRLPGSRVGGGGGKRPAWAPLLPTMLKPAGYRCYHSGKWHIDGQVLANGFDRSYRLNDHDRFFNPQNHFEDDKKLPAVKRGSGHYSTTHIADHAIKCLREHGESHADQPFFQYLAFIAPHFPLQALPGDIDRYRDVYTKGWNKIREQRYRRIQQMGLVGGKLSEVELEIGPPYHRPRDLEILGEDEVNRPLPWKQLTETQKRFQATKMAIHAAMVDRMDQEIGRVLKQIREMGQLEDTLVIFLSDNGASAEIMVRGDGHKRAAAMGSADSYLCLGPGWSTTGNTPFRRHKTWVHEGGISTPMIVSWPAGIRNNGELRFSPGHVIDIVPTLLHITGAKRTVLDQALPGKSLVSTFSKDEPVQRSHLWWAHEGHRAIRQGDWKLVAAKGEPWELYNLKQDRSETSNLAAQFPEKIKQLEKLWLQDARDFAEQSKPSNK